MKSGYCPWCGAVIEPLAFYARTKNIEWNRCNTWGCKGSHLDIITDERGFVIHPKHIRGRYIYKRPIGDKDA
jgi:hypothetical protein